MRRSSRRRRNATDTSEKSGCESSGVRKKPSDWIEKKNAKRSLTGWFVSLRLDSGSSFVLTALWQELGKEGSAARVIAKSRAEAVKRSAARASSSLSHSASHSKLLRSRAAIASTIPDVPHEPLIDNWYAYDDQYVLRADYDDALSDAVRADRDGLMRAGGYRVEEAWERAIRMAVAGLDISPCEEAPDVIMGSAG